MKIITASSTPDNEGLQVAAITVIATAMAVTTNTNAKFCKQHAAKWIEPIICILQESIRYSETLQITAFATIAIAGLSASVSASHIDDSAEIWQRANKWMAHIFNIIQNGHQYQESLRISAIKAIAIASINISDSNGRDMTCYPDFWDHIEKWIAPILNIIQDPSQYSAAFQVTAINALACLINIDILSDDRVKQWEVGNRLIGSILKILKNLTQYSEAVQIAVVNISTDFFQYADQWIEPTLNILQDPTSYPEALQIACLNYIMSTNHFDGTKKLALMRDIFLEGNKFYQLGTAIQRRNWAFFRGLFICANEPPLLLSALKHLLMSLSNDDVDALNLLLCAITNSRGASIICRFGHRRRNEPNIDPNIDSAANFVAKALSDLDNELLDEQNIDFVVLAALFLKHDDLSYYLKHDDICDLWLYYQNARSNNKLVRSQYILGLILISYFKIGKVLYHEEDQLYIYQHPEYIPLKLQGVTIQTLIEDIKIVLLLLKFPGAPSSLAIVHTSTEIQIQQLKAELAEEKRARQTDQSQLAEQAAELIELREQLAVIQRATIQPQVMPQLTPVSQQISPPTAVLQLREPAVNPSGFSPAFHQPTQPSSNDPRQPLLPRTEQGRYFPKCCCTIS